ncbi:hypothetical protein M0802_004966 [Mischocyttarus mexicanus]|nr:hypothetical protein M0802_004966 [Mischocyttarus mexicanus]
MDDVCISALDLPQPYNMQHHNPQKHNTTKHLTPGIVCILETSMELRQKSLLMDIHSGYLCETPVQYDASN